MEGYLKVGATAATALRKASGEGGLFVERLAQDEPERPRVRWIAKEKAEPADYHREVLRQAKEGGTHAVFRRGGKDNLGIAVSGEVAVRRWVIHGMLRSWGPGAVEEWLHDLGWRQLQGLSPPRGGGRLWLFSGTQPMGEEVNRTYTVEIELVDGTVVQAAIRPWVRSPPHGREPAAPQSQWVVSGRAGWGERGRRREGRGAGRRRRWRHGPNGPPGGE